MDRRAFLKTTAASAVAGTLAAAAAPRSAQAKDRAPAYRAADYSAAEHRRRLENIDRCRRAIRSCLRTHLIGDYLPGQGCYNLGEYPATKPWSLETFDEQELDRLRDHGIQLIQWFDDWADPLRLFGGDKYTPANPADARRFIEMAHGRGMKVIPYASSCFLERTDPDFRQEWSREGDNLLIGYWNMARCSPGSPGWRAYLLPRIARILDGYGSLCPRISWPRPSSTGKATSSWPTTGARTSGWKRPMRTCPTMRGLPFRRRRGICRDDRSSSFAVPISTEGGSAATAH